MSASVVPTLRPLFHAEVEVGPVETIARLEAGGRRVVAITGGQVTPADAGGPFRGRILPVGEDWQWARADGTLELVAHYVIELDGGDRIEVEAEGLRHGPTELLERMARGEHVDPHEYYFRTAVRLRTDAADPAIERANRMVLVCAGERRDRLVCLTFYEVL